MLYEGKKIKNKIFSILLHVNTIIGKHIKGWIQCNVGGFFFLFFFKLSSLI